MSPAGNTTSSRETFQFKSFHELMTRRVAEILLVSSTYDAYIMQEDGPLAERIIHEYRGLNLSRPPRLSWISNGTDALEEIRTGEYDLVVVMPHIGGMDSYELCREIEGIKPSLPVYFFGYDAGQLLMDKGYVDCSNVTRTLIWSGNTDLLLAVVKSQEDMLNVEIDTRLAGVRVIIFVEDSPLYLSSLLPVLYREIVLQTQSVMDDSLNEKDRLLRMRTRPKILVAENFEDAWALYEKYKQYLFCVISDVRFEKGGVEDPHAGLKLLRAISSEKPDVPLLVLSSEEENREAAEAIPALFSDKRSAKLHAELDSFFTHSLCFGDFLFRMPDQEIVARAGSLRGMCRQLQKVPLESIVFHARRNEFSRWLMARFEMEIAQRIRVAQLEDFTTADEARNYIISIIREKLRKRQKGFVSEFYHGEFDPESDFVKIGKGSLGGKARGLAFISHLWQKTEDFTGIIDGVEIVLPKTLVITTEGYDLFVEHSSVQEKLTGGERDTEVEQLFLDTEFPPRLQRDLEAFLHHTHSPLAVRSSAILEDAHYRASAGAYNTYMLPNNDADPQVRLQQLIDAVKLVYSSVFQETPRVLARHSVYRQEDDKMAVIIQHLAGEQYDDYYYPAISGVAQSCNFYPVSRMKPGDGVAHIGLGLGRIVVDGGTALRFSPKYPKLLPQFSRVEDILQNSQRYFYALWMGEKGNRSVAQMMDKVDVNMACHHLPVIKLASTYSLQDNRIRDCFTGQGQPVLTFAAVLKYNQIPLCKILTRLLEMGEQGMGCPVEIEFAVKITKAEEPKFYLLQIRPMAITQSRVNVRISQLERESAWCHSTMALGRSREERVTGIVVVKREMFDPARTREIAAEIEKMNLLLKNMGRRYVLIGPGRWGSSDRWLGIPVKWSSITEVHTIVETSYEKLHAEPSQGSHFFHNITSLGINYLSIPAKGDNRIDMEWIDSLAVVEESNYLKYIEFLEPALLKIDGKQSLGVILPPGGCEV